MTALLLAAPSAFASCDASIIVRSRYMTLQVYEIYPIVVTEDTLGYREFEVDVSAMWDRLARGLATAADYQRRIEEDRALSARLVRTPVSLILINRKVRPAFDTTSRDSALTDSVLTLFHGSGPDSTAELHSILVESHLRGSAVESLLAVVDLPPEEEGEEGSDAGWDTTVVLDITYGDCEQPIRRPRLFTLPPKLTADRRFWLMSGLYYTQKDAKRFLDRMRNESRIEGKTVKIRVKGPVLQRAFPRGE